MIDWQRINELKSEIGEESFPEVVDLFIEEATEAIERLQNGPDLATLGAELHSLKGTALNLGFANLGELCQIGESRAAQGRAEEIALGPIIDCYENSKHVFLAGMVNGQTQ
ncbi:Hpt domain-containing protein [Sulfitobacter sp. HNIBRBA3233]|uniref:Hpt domain-containing protein n=1 Tax=Sulfitobacter marinivivus TaxID=3158558 RepID=UPI0032DF8F1A